MFVAINGVMHKITLFWNQLSKILRIFVKRIYQVSRTYTIYYLRNPAQDVEYISLKMADVTICTVKNVNMNFVGFA